MKLRDLPFVSLAPLGVVTLPAAAGRGLEGDLWRFLGRLRVGTAVAPTRQ